MCPIFSCFVFRYRSKLSCGATSADTRSVTAIPADSSAATFSGLFVISRTFLTAQLLQHLGRQLVLAAIGSIAQLHIRFDRIHPLVLQLVGFQLRHQADPAALLLFIKQNPRALFGDLAQSQLQL